MGASLKKSDGVSRVPTIADPLKMGVRLSFLAALPVKRGGNFSDCCKLIKKMTKGLTGYRSLAMLLSGDKRRRHLVSSKPDVFISYAWAGDFAATTSALRAHFKHSEDPFVWMDVAIVDQHAAASTDIDFDQWATTFRESLTEIGRALLVLTPAEKPIATGRSWCCFEWAVIKSVGIQFEYCVDPQDENKLIQRMCGGMGRDDFNTIFGAINVERAVAFKPADQTAILKLMQSIGIIEVNDMIMKSVKEWLVQVNEKAVQRFAGQETKEVVYLLNARGLLHDALGEVDSIRTYFERALIIAKKLGNESLTAALLNNLATLLETKGQFDAAEPLFRDALEIVRKVHGPEHDLVAAALSNLGGLRRTKGDYKGAENLYREAQAMYAKMHGPDHALVASSMGNLAIVLFTKGDYNSAEPLMREALATNIKVHGSDHPLTATSMCNLAALLYKKADYDSAEPLFRQTLAVETKVHGRDHPSVATALSNLGGVLVKQAKYDAAEPLYREGLAVFIRAFGREHPSVATSLSNLAILLRDRGREADKEVAIAMGKEALAIRERLLGPEHPSTREAREDWG